MADKNWLGVFQMDVAANRPTAVAPVGGATAAYYATDTGVFSIWNGTAWVTLGTSGASSVARNANVAAAGSTVTDAAQLAVGFTTVTGADATKGAKLPATPVAGTLVIVKNNANAVLKLWPDAAATINAIGSNADLAMAAYTSAVLVADSTTQWFSVPLLPS